MDFYSIENLIDEIVAFYNSGFFRFIKILLGIYVLILIYDIVLLLIQRGIGQNIRQMRFGMDLPQELVSKKDRMRERWKVITKRLESGNESEDKVAIIEADTIIDDLIKRMGYKGANMGERLANIPPGQLSELPAMKEAHEIRNRVIHEEDFQVDKELAKDVLSKYEHLLREFQVLD